MVYDTIQELFMNIGLFGFGFTLAFAGLILGIARGFGKDNKYLALTVTAFTWLIALLVPNMPWALSLFFIGMFSLTLTFNPILEQYKDSNIYVVGAIVIIINLFLVLGTGFYSASLDLVQTNAEAETIVTQQLETFNLGLDDAVDVSGLAERTNQSSQDSSLISAVFNNLAFDVYASMLNIPLIIFKITALAITALLAPLSISQLLSAHVSNTVVLYLISIYAIIFNLIIFYKLGIFVTNKRGTKS